MKCPKCGSEHVQFSSSTTGGGFSAGKSCCGYIILGPIGLICGACGNKETKNEFWICSSCGHRFSNFDGQQKMSQEAKQLEDAAKRKQYMREIEAANITREEVLEKLKKIDKERTEMLIKRKEYLKELCKSEDPNIKKIAKKLYTTVPYVLAIIAFIVGVICLFTDFFVGVALIVGAGVVVLFCGNKDGEHSKELSQLDSTFGEIDSIVNSLEAEKDTYKKLEEKFKFINKT